MLPRDAHAACPPVRARTELRGPATLSRGVLFKSVRGIFQMWRMLVHSFVRVCVRQRDRSGTSRRLESAAAAAMDALRDYDPTLGTSPALVRHHSPPVPVPL